MQELLNHKILDVEIATSVVDTDAMWDANAIRFTTETSKIAYLTEADCCSETWFSEIINLDFLINQVVTEVVELDMPEFDDGNGRQRYDKFYGYRVATPAGHCTIAFRNSSNGYYGGSCELAEKEPKANWVSIKHLTDWTAYGNTDGSYLKYYKLKAFW